MLIRVVSTVRAQQGSLLAKQNLLTIVMTILGKSVITLYYYQYKTTWFIVGVG